MNSSPTSLAPLNAGKPGRSTEETAMLVGLTVKPIAFGPA